MYIHVHKYIYVYIQYVHICTISAYKTSFIKFQLNCKKEDTVLCAMNRDEWKNPPRRVGKLFTPARLTLVFCRMSWLQSKLVI